MLNNSQGTFLKCTIACVAAFFFIFSHKNVVAQDVVFQDHQSRKYIGGGGGGAAEDERLEFTYHNHDEMTKYLRYSIHFCSSQFYFTFDD